MKIVYFSYIEDIHGISIGAACKTKEFLNGLYQLGHEIHLFWRSHRPLQNERETFERKTNSPLRKFFRRYYHEPKLLLSNVKHIVQENKILKNIEPDVVVARLSLLRFSSLLLCQLKKIPFVIEIDNPPIYENSTFYGKDYFHLNFFSETIERSNLLHADAMIVVSNVLRDYFIGKGASEDKLFFIPNGADPDKFFPRPKDVNLSKEFNVRNELVIGWIGSGWKWLETMVDAVGHILVQRKDVKFLFVGGCPDNMRLQQIARELNCPNRVILKEYIPYEKVPQYLSLMDIVIAPYPKMELWYPSPLKVFEYMAGGKVVVANAEGQLKEVIQDGYNGCFFDSEIQDDLANKILHLIDSPDLRERMGVAARKTILEKYTWKHHAQTIESILLDVLKKRESVR